MQNKKLALERDKALSRSGDMKIQLDLGKDEVRAWSEQYEKLKKQLQKIQRQNNELVDELGQSQRSMQQERRVSRDTRESTVVTELNTTIT